MLLISDREIDAWISRSLRERWVPILHCLGPCGLLAGREFAGVP
jgi:hypothetical protein